MVHPVVPCMRIPTIATCLFLLAVFAIPGPSGADPQPTIVGPNSHLGDILAVGSMTSGVCSMPPTSLAVQMGPKLSFFVMGVSITSTCQAQITSLCTAPTQCQTSPQVGLAYIPQDGVKLASTPDIPTSFRSVGSCTMSNQVDSVLQGLGYASDLLSQSEEQMAYSYCPGSSVQIDHASGTTEWEEGWGWRNDAHYSNSNNVPACNTCGGMAAAGEHGDFHCGANPANPFCNHEPDYVHSLQAEAQGYTDGSGWCYWYWSGKTPPNINHSCTYENVNG